MTTKAHPLDDEDQVKVLSYVQAEGDFHDEAEPAFWMDYTIEQKKDQPPVLHASWMSDEDESGRRTVLSGRWELVFVGGSNKLEVR